MLQSCLEKRTQPPEADLLMPRKTIKDSKRTQESHRWLRRAIASAIAFVVPFASIAVASESVNAEPPSPASPSSIELPVNASDPERRHQANKHANAVRDQRVGELVSSGMTRNQAIQEFEAEQSQIAAETREELGALLSQGRSFNEAASELDLYQVGSSEESSDSVGLLSEDNVRIYDEDLWYESPCACWHVDTEWEHVPDLKQGDDVVAMRTHESVGMLGGTAYLCNAGPSPDECRYTGADRETRHGVGETFRSESGDYGYLVMSVVDYTDGPGPCQLFTEYIHTWGSTRITGFGISKDGVSISWEYYEGDWQKQEAGPIPWGVTCGL